MKIGLIDCDGKNFKNPYPNLALMKLSAWHKQQGDIVEWYNPIVSSHMDKVYISKVFSFSKDYEYPIYADEVIRGGSGYAIKMVDGKEVYDKDKDTPLPSDVEHIYPDYSIYGITDTAYGFTTRGCPRNCDFCHVAQMQGLKSYKVADLSEFWDGQKNIVLYDPNILACRDWKDIFNQLIGSKAYVNFSQGLDIRLVTDETIDMLKQIKTKYLHFAWDKPEDKDIILPKIQHLSEATGWNRRKIIVYCLIGDRERRVTDGDLDRIYSLQKIAYPYVMIYDKSSLPWSHELKKLQRWVNNRFIWETTPTFDDYLNSFK